MKGIIQNRIMPARAQSQNEKFPQRLSTNQSTMGSMKVRSGQVTTFVVCAAVSLSFQAVLLLMKLATNHQVFFNLV